MKQCICSELFPTKGGIVLAFIHHLQKKDWDFLLTKYVTKYIKKILSLTTSSLVKLVNLVAMGDYH